MSSPPEQATTGDEKPIPAGQGLASAAILMVVLTFAARIAGMVRMMVVGSAFGAGGDINSFFAAFTIPDLIYFLIAGGAARTAFVPVFTEYLAHGRRREAWRVFSTVFWLLLILGGVVVIGGSLFAPQVARLSALGWLGSAPERVDVCARIMRIIFPAQLFLVLGSLLMGTLNAHKHFLWPALGPLVYDIVFIIGAVIGGTLPESEGLVVMAWGSVVGALLGSVVIQIPPLAARGAKLLPVFDLKDEGVRRTIRLALPVILGLAVAEINWVVVRILATMCQENAPAVLEYANRLWKLPSGVFAAGIAIAVFPTLSEHYARGDVKSYRRDFSFAMRNTLFLVLPVTVAFATLSTPIVRMLFQRGSFDPSTSPLVGTVVLWLSPGMISLGISYIAARAFYARQNTVTPVVCGVISIFACLGLGYWATQTTGVVGLAMATSATAVLNAALLIVLLKREVGQLDGGRIARSLLRILPGAVALGVICWAGSAWLTGRLGTESELAKLLTVMAPVTVGTVVYVVSCALLHAEELKSAWRIIARKRPETVAKIEAEEALDDQ